MIEFLQLRNDINEIKQILDIIKDFVISNNKNVKSTEYFICLGNKTFLQIIEETFNDPDIDVEEKSKHIDLLSTFLKKQKSCYANIILSNDPEDLEMKRRIDETVKFLGFSGNDGNMFSELENTLERLEKKEIVL